MVPRAPLTKIPTSSAESKRHLRLLCRFAGAICTIGIVIASLLPGDNRPQSGVAPGQVQPWNYGDRFFQQPPPDLGGVDMDRIFADKDPVMLSLATAGIVWLLVLIR